MTTNRKDASRCVLGIATAAFIAASFGIGSGPIHAAGRDVPAATEGGGRESIADMKLFRFAFDNDTALGSDDAYSAGWSFQLHSRMMDTWNPAFAGWIGKFPGLGDDGRGGRVTRFAVAFSQIMVTPNDITIEAPQPNDAPWAGLAGASGTWSSYDNRKLAGLQIYVGCMGPCSQAQDVQEFVHNDLGAGDDPAGWGNQLSNQLLGNVNYEYRWKLVAAAPEKHAFGRFAQDLAAGGQVGAGNLATYARASIEYRFGWGMPQGFTKIPDPPGLGLALDPVYFDPGQPIPETAHWSYVFNLVGRFGSIGYLAPAEGGETESGYDHPSLDPPGESDVVAGIHIVRVPFGIHLTYYHALDEGDGDVASSVNYWNLSFEYRF
jgi:hypothetical protein